jgi:hypothetical protein
MIPLSFGIRPVGLPEDCCDFLCIQITHSGWFVFFTGMRAISLHWAIASGSRRATKAKKLWIWRNRLQSSCSSGCCPAGEAARRQFRVPMDTFLSFSRCCKNASTSAASKSDSDSAVISRCLRSETKRSSNFHVSRYDHTV